MRSKILIYRDYGCADVSSLYGELASYFREKGISVDFTDAAEIKNGVLNRDVKAFFLGGGAGTPYMRKLAGEGNDRIRRYITGDRFLTVRTAKFWPFTICRNPRRPL